MRNFCIQKHIYTSIYIKNTSYVYIFSSQPHNIIDFEMNIPIFSYKKLQPQKIYSDLRCAYPQKTKNLFFNAKLKDRGISRNLCSRKFIQVRPSQFCLGNTKMSILVGESGVRAFKLSLVSKFLFKGLYSGIFFLRESCSFSVF